MTAEITTAFGRLVKLGETASVTKSFSADQVRIFADISGTDSTIFRVLFTLEENCSLMSI